VLVVYIHSYCMCYENGYIGVSGVFHRGPSCLKFDGDGEKVESPAARQPDALEPRIAFEGGCVAAKTMHRSGEPLMPLARYLLLITPPF
jgi:hypothetical protein